MEVALFLCIHREIETLLPSIGLPKTMIQNNGIDFEDESKITMHKLEINAYHFVLHAFHVEGLLS